MEQMIMGKIVSSEQMANMLLLFHQEVREPFCKERWVTLHRVQSQGCSLCCRYDPLIWLLDGAMVKVDYSGGMAT